MTDTKTLAVLIFSLTYLGVSFGRLPMLRLDRRGWTITGSVLMVLCGVLSFQDAWAAINSETIVLLLGMMVINVYLEACGFFEYTARLILARVGSPVRLLVGLSVVSGVLSALFVNDTVCLMLTPPSLAAVRGAGFRPLPFLIALAMRSPWGISIF